MRESVEAVRLVAFRARNLRCFEAMEMSPGPGINVVCGENGAGKSTVLEGIHVLGMGRSFRTRQTRELARFGSEDGVVTVVGEVRREVGGAGAVAVVARFARGHMAICLGGERVARGSALARVVRVFFAGPEGQGVVCEGGGRRRRGLLDAVVFHVEPGYGAVLGAYREAVEQRNAALRMEARDGELDAWEYECASAGERVGALRAAHASRWLAIAERILEGWLPSADVGLAYRRGWPEAETLKDALRSHRMKDRRLGYSGWGPHRGDIDIVANGRKVREVLSRGEAKLVSVALAVAQVAYVRERTGEMPVLLLDDVLAELDGERRGRVLDVLEQMQAQVFLTCNGMDGVPVDGQHEVFHVKQGRVDRVI